MTKQNAPGVNRGRLWWLGAAPAEPMRGRALLRLAERAMEPQPTPPARLHAHRAGKWERNVACLLSTPLAKKLGHIPSPNARKTVTQKGDGPTFKLPCEQALWRPPRFRRDAAA